MSISDDRDFTYHMFLVFLIIGFIISLIFILPEEAPERTSLDQETSTTLNNEVPEELGLLFLYIQYIKSPDCVANLRQAGIAYPV